MAEIKIKLKGIIPIIIIKRKTKKFTYENEINILSPFYFTKRLLYNIVLYLRFKKLGYPIIKCEGCGRGYVEYKLKDFYGQDMYVCQHCISWYDFRYAFSRLEKDWLLEAERKLHG